MLSKPVRDDERPVHVRHEELPIKNPVPPPSAIVRHLGDRQPTNLERDVSVALELDRRDRALRRDVDVEVGLGDVHAARAITLAFEPLLVVEFVGSNLSEWASPAAGALYVAAFGGLALQLVRPAPAANASVSRSPELSVA